MAALVGCGNSGTLRVTKVASSTQKPGNLAFYLDVKDNGRPVAGLQEKDFRVYEDGKLVSPKKGKRALLDADVVSANFAIIQVDLSGPMADSEYLPELAETVAHFAQDLNERQEVAVNAFDGNDEVAPFLAFGSGKEQFRNLADGLRKFRPRSRNSNLYGAVYQGISALEEKLNNSALPDKQATLIVFTDRADLSHTVGIEQMKEKLRQTAVQIYIIGVGEKIDRTELTMLGRTGTFLSNDPKAFKKGFEEINSKLVSLADGRYVLSFCSTKRKGKHKVEVAIDTPTGEVKFSQKFDAAGFKNGCSPKTKPVFEEIEAMKTDAATKQKELDAKAKEQEEAEAQQAAEAALKKAAPGGTKEAMKDGGKAGSKDNAKAGAKEAAKTSATPPANAKPAAAQKEVAKAAPPKAAAPASEPAEEEEEAPPPPKKAASGPVKQVIDKE
ncbi:MAG TPA: VWA domain-containing protein [Polyangia bacterium]